MQDKDFLTIPQLAEILGISRIAVYKWVKSGKIKANKVGKMYLIPRSYLDSVIGRALTPQAKKEIEKAVKKTITNYGDVLKMLGQE